jgi:hypothetical protein
MEPLRVQAIVRVTEFPVGRSEVRPCAASWDCPANGRRRPSVRTPALCEMMGAHPISARRFRIPMAIKAPGNSPERATSLFRLPSPARKR